MEFDFQTVPIVGVITYPEWISVDQPTPADEITETTLVVGRFTQTTDITARVDDPS